MAGSGQGFLPCPPGVQYCVRVSSMPAGVSLAKLFVNDMALGTHPDKATTASIFQDTVANADLPGTLERAVRMRAEAMSKEAIVGEPGQLQQLLAALNEWYTPGEGEADIWCVGVLLGGGFGGRVLCWMMSGVLIHVGALNKCSRARRQSNHRPGRRHKLPVSQFKWMSWMLSPGVSGRL